MPILAVFHHDWAKRRVCFHTLGPFQDTNQPVLEIMDPTIGGIEQGKLRIKLYQQTEGHGPRK